MYVIKHKPSGSYLPHFRGRPGRGGTCVNIGDKGMPRLFANKVAAKNALRWWLEGVVGVKIFYGDAFEEASESWTTEKRPERRAEDMEIVKVELREVKE